MVKSKVGAEPNKKVKHSFTRDAGIHEGIHRDELKIGSFCVSSISYEDKFVDLIECGQDEPKKLGYKEWKFIIGCHILWFDDIKDFARYYNLQYRLAFPLNRTTEECMENHLIHLHSGRTI